LFYATSSPLALSVPLSLSYPPPYIAQKGEARGGRGERRGGEEQGKESKIPLLLKKKQNKNTQRKREEVYRGEDPTGRNTAMKCFGDVK
jgi:hypothetical protein